MKFGFRMPSLKKRIFGSSSLKRKLGFRVPKGLGILTNPEKALYNKVYNKTTVGIESLGKSKKSKKRVAESGTEGLRKEDVEHGTGYGCLILIILIPIFYFFIKGCCMR